MTVNECIQEVLALLDEVGTSDYSNRIHGFINRAQITIATQWGWIMKKKTLTAEKGAIVPLPADVFSVETCKDGSWEIDYTEDGQYGIRFLEDAASYTITYKAYPDTITQRDGSKELQLRPEYHKALCALVAALTQDNEHDKRAYQIYMNQYNDEMGMILRARQQNNKAKVVVRR